MGVTDSVSRQEHLNPWSHETRKKRDHRPEGREGKADKQRGERGDETANGKSHTRARTTTTTTTHETMKATTKATTILALAILSASLLLVEVEGGRRLNDYLRAIDPDTKQPAAQSVPFTSWPASPPASLQELLAPLFDDYVNGLPGIFQEQLQDNLFDDEDGLIFGDDGLLDTEFIGIDFADITGNLVDAVFGVGGDFISALNFFGISK